MRRIVTGGVLVLLTVCVGVAAARLQDRPAGGKDLFRSKTVWTGEIRQGGEVFPATVHVTDRVDDRIKGEVHFQAGGGLNKLTFQGNILEGGTVAWITDKVEGDVTYPGLYTGRLKGKTLSGNWQVPSAGQYDRFSVTLAE